MPRRRACRRTPSAASPGAEGGTTPNDTPARHISRGRVSPLPDLRARRGEPGTLLKHKSVITVHTRFLPGSFFPTPVRQVGDPACVPRPPQPQRPAAARARRRQAFTEGHLVCILSLLYMHLTSSLSSLFFYPPQPGWHLQTHRGYGDGDPWKPHPRCLRDGRRLRTCRGGDVTLHGRKRQGDVGVHDYHPSAGQRWGGKALEQITRQKSFHTERQKH